MFCFDTDGAEFARKLACVCHAPRLLPQLEFIKGNCLSARLIFKRNINFLSFSVIFSVDQHWQTFGSTAEQRRENWSTSGRASNTESQSSGSSVVAYPLRYTSSGGAHSARVGCRAQ